MGVTPQHLTDDWNRQQNTDYKQRDHYTVVKLPCCGTMVEADKNLGDQYVTCPNRHCGKRHLISWGMRTTVRSERPALEL